MKLKFIYWVLFIALSFAYSCSPDNENGNEPVVDNDFDVAVIDGENISMPSHGTIIAQYKNHSALETIDKLVDNNPDTYYSIRRSSIWIMWKNETAVTVNNYSISSSKLYPQNDPRSWVLSASNDSVNWVRLDSKDDVVFAERREMQVYDLDNNIPYSYYKLEILENNGGDRIHLGGWGLNTEIVYSIEDLMPYASGNTFSENTPMGKHYENRYEASEADKEWLLNPDNEPPVPPALTGSLSWQNFNVNLYPFDKPLPADINQHSIGDCGALAALGSLVYVKPDFIQTVIREGENETFIVSMFDPKGNPLEVSVSSKFLAGANGSIAAVTGKYDVACWSTILEKAIMKYNAVFEVNTNIEGIGSEHVLPLFTGNGSSFAFSPNRLSRENLKRAVEVSLKQGKLVIGGFNKADLPVDGSKTVTGHAYTLMHTSNPGFLFVMRNPWGGNPDQPATLDGILNIPNDDAIASTIDLRIVDPGIAGNEGVSDPYRPPVFQSGYNMRVSTRLMVSGD